MSSTQDLVLQCAGCGKEFTARAELVVLPGSPALEALQKGQLNSATCPGCGQGGVLAVPLVLYQPVHRRAICYIPGAGSMSKDDTGAIVNELGRWLRLEAGNKELPDGLSLETGIISDYNALVRLAREEIIHEENRLRARLGILESMLAAGPEERARLVQEHRESLGELAGLARQVSQQALETGQPEIAGNMQTLAGELETAGK